MSAAPLDSVALRADFPALQQEIHGKPLVYLDNAATTHKPRAVLDALDQFHRRDNSNVHRGVHTLSQRATDSYEGARARIAQFLSVKTDEIVFVRGATEGINLIANAFLRPRLQQATKYSSRRWSTTPTSSRGSWRATRPERSSASRRCRRRASCCSMSSNRC